MTSLLFGLLLSARAPATPASPAETPRRVDSVVGEVTAVAGGARSLSVKTDAGPILEVRADDATSVVRARPGSASLSDATAARLDEIVVGDRVLARGRLADDKGSLAARQIVLMTQGDIARKHEAERADWRRRGILGVVSAVDPGKGEITLQARRFGATQAVVIPTAGRAVVFRRYAPDSVKFGDAHPSSLAELRVGDQLRALGDRTADGSGFAPEQVVFGTFVTVSGAVSGVDAAAGEVTVRDDETRKPVRISVGADTRLRRLPPEVAARLGRPREAGPGRGGGTEGAAGAGGPGGPGGFRPGGGGPEDMLERLPAIALGDVKPGDRILVCSTKGNDPAHLNAIALVTGLEALPAPRAGGPRGQRGGEPDLPSDLMDLGLSIP
jgi:hypothetical protein